MSNPSIRVILPDNGVVGGNYQVDIYGGDFQDGATVAFEIGVAAPKVKFQHDEYLIVDVDVAADAAKKKYNVTVTNPDGGTVTKAAAFEVVGAAVLAYA